MFFSGICDEAGNTIDVQIKAHRELRWKFMELRLIDGQNFTMVSDEVFEDIYRKICEAGMSVSCFASAIANWARPITCDPQIDQDDLKHAIPRMHRFGTRFIRVMSYPNDVDRPVPENTWRLESIRRMKDLAKIAEDGGVTLLHENCSGWGGLSAENSRILLGEVNSPALKLVYDTGNPVTYGQNAWEYYKRVLPDIVYVHIKDARKIDGKDVYTYPGEGSGFVKEILRDLLAKGYDGGFSIEPHLAAIIHTGDMADNEAKLYDSYVEYGRRLIRIFQDL